MISNKHLVKIVCLVFAFTSCSKACRREYTFGVNNKIRPEKEIQTQQIKQQEEQSENYFQTNWVNQTANCLMVDSQSFSNSVNDWYSTNNETCGQVCNEVEQSTKDLITDSCLNCFLESTELPEFAQKINSTCENISKCVNEYLVPSN